MRIRLAMCGLAFAALAGPAPVWAEGLWLPWTADPQVVYLLLLGGLAGLFLEILTPGALLPGIAGAVSLILGLQALSVLPSSAAGLGLIVLGYILFALEAHVASYGILGLLAALAIFFGSTMLFRPDAAGVAPLPMSTILVTVGGISAAMFAAAWLAARSQRRRSATGAAGLLGLTGRVQRWQGRSGQVLVRGELWTAICKDCPEASGLAVGSPVTVEAIDGLTLRVKPADSAPNPRSSS